MEVEAGEYEPFDKIRDWYQKSQGLPLDDFDSPEVAALVEWKPPPASRTVPASTLYAVIGALIGVILIILVFFGVFFFRRKLPKPLGQSSADDGNQNVSPPSNLPPEQNPAHAGPQEVLPLQNLSPDPNPADARSQNSADAGSQNVLPRRDLPAEAS